MAWDMLERFVVDDRVRFMSADEPEVWIKATVDRDSFGKKFLQMENGIVYYPSDTDRVEFL